MFILEECDSKDELNEAERFWIDWYRRNTNFRLTNGTDGGDGGQGLKHSDETRKIIGKATTIALTGKPQSPAHKAKSAAARLGTKNTPKARKLISASKIGKKCSPVTRKKIAETLTGRALSEAHRRRVSESLIGKERSLEHRWGTAHTRFHSTKPNELCPLCLAGK